MRWFRRRRRIGLLVLLVLLFLLLVLGVRVYEDHRWRHHVLDVVVVEEHHEVLPYWHLAAWSGKLLPRHNTLLHIDAHSDMAPPQPAPRFPLFRSASSIGQVRMMMQRNDVFIVGSIISNFLHRVVWSWPSWDESEHEETGDYLHQTLEVGMTRVRMKVSDDEDEKAFCVCFTDRTGKSCQFLNTSDPLEDYHVPEKDCKVGVKGVFEIVRDSFTHSKMISGNWFPSPLSSSSSSASSFILDIDLDFFGTENPAVVLERTSGLQWSTLEEISKIVGSLFCPITTEAETESDKLLGSLIDLVLIDCKTTVSRPLVHKDLGTCETILRDVGAFVTPFLKRAVDTRLRIFCSGDTPLLTGRVMSLTKLLTNLTEMQLRGLQRVGFCLRSSPQTLGFDYMEDLRQFGVCIGANEPGDSAVSNYYASKDEINSAFKKLQKLLSTRNFPTPGIVTICRSMRDGYTSKPHFDLIEESLLQVLAKSFPEKEIRVFYDEHLMGGREGRVWAKRSAET